MNDKWQITDSKVGCRSTNLAHRPTGVRQLRPELLRTKSGNEFSQLEAAATIPNTSGANTRYDGSLG
jgi:hypothetical protein